MEYVLVKNGIVEGVIVADAAFIETIQNDYQHIEPVDTLYEQGLGVGPGWTWSLTNGFVAPSAPAPEPAPAPVYEWYIDIGPFYDRFGAAKMQVLTSTDPGVKAILADLNIRKWVDLKRPDVAQALQYVGSVIPAVTTQLQDSILNTPVEDIENLALRKLYF